MTDWNAYYQTRFQYDARRNVVWKCICEWLQPEIALDAAVLEFGAGYCDFINSIKAGRKLAVDMSTGAWVTMSASAQIRTSGSSVNAASVTAATLWEKRTQSCLGW